MKKNEGFTLIELILSIAILSVILVTVLTVFSSAYLWINKSGDSTKKLFLAQNELEANIEKRLGTEIGEIEIPLNVKVRGGFLKSDNLITFLSKVPAVTLEGVFNGLIEQNSHVYGQSPSSLTIKIKTYNIPKGSTVTCKLLKQDGSELSPNRSGSGTLNTTTMSTQNEEEGQIDISLSLPTGYSSQIKDGIYKISVSSTYLGKELLKPYERNYVVDLISKVAVGNNGEILNSSDGKTWYKLNNSSSHLKSVVYGGNINEKKFVAVGDNGSILYSTDGLNWSVANFSNNNIDINKIIYTDMESNTFLAIGNNGSQGILLTSFDGINWTSKDVSSTTNFTDATWSPTSKTLLVTGEGSLSLAVLTQNSLKNWILNEISDGSFNNFTNIVANPVDESAVLIKTNISGLPDFGRYYKNDVDAFVFGTDGKDPSIAKVMNVLYKGNTFLLIDENGQFFNLIKDASDKYIWEKTNEVKQLSIDNTVPVYLYDRDNVLSVTNNNKIYNYVYDEVNDVFNWTLADIKGVNITQINSMTGK